MAFKQTSAAAKGKATAKEAPKGKAAAGKEWYNTGKRGEQKSEEIQEMMEKGKILRFWLPAEKSAKITFLDSEGFYFYEHNVFMRGKWNNFFTCRKDFDNCLERANPGSVIRRSSCFSDPSGLLRHVRSNRMLLK